MSAFVCSPEHIATLVAWHAANGYSGERFNSEQAAGDLMRANIASVQYRYPENVEGDRPGIQDMMDEELVMETQRLATDASFCAAAKRRKPVEIIKLAQSLDYQSCERPDWGKAPAKSLIDSIILRAATKLADYDDSPWSI